MVDTVKNVPVIAQVAHALHYLLCDATADSSSPVLSRIHFHCLAYHCIAERLPASHTYFRDATASVARGALTATLVASDNTAAGPAFSSNSE